MGAIVNSNSIIDEASIINSGSIIEHDCHIKFLHIFVLGFIWQVM